MRPADLQDVVFTGMRHKIAELIERPSFTRFIALVIVFNAIILGLETDAQMRAEHGLLLMALDKGCIAIYVSELLLKFYAYRASFFKLGWNWFDLTVVVISLIPAAGFFAVVRSLRIIRVLRLISVLPQMRRVVSALFWAIPGMSSIIMVLLLIFYVSAVLTTQIFGQHTDPLMQQLFGSISKSMYSLFQMMTLDGWSENIAEPTMKIFPSAGYFFVPFIIVTSFAVLNLFIGIIVDAMQAAHRRERRAELRELEEHTEHELEALHEDVMALRGDVADVKALILELHNKDRS